MKGIFKLKPLLLQCKNCLKLLYLIVSPALLFTINANAQNQVTAKGHITNSSGLPVSGATIIVKGSSSGVSSNDNGDFEISTVSNSTLVVSSVGYSTKEVTAKANQVVAIVLNSTAKGLEEVVVVGYGTQRKEAVTGSVASISGDKIREVHLRQIFHSRCKGVWQEYKFHKRHPSLAPLCRFVSGAHGH